MKQIILIFLLILTPHGLKKAMLNIQILSIRFLNIF